MPLEKLDAVKDLQRTIRILQGDGDVLFIVEGQRKNDESIQDEFDGDDDDVMMMLVVVVAMAAGAAVGTMEQSLMAVVRWKQRGKSLSSQPLTAYTV